MIKWIGQHIWDFISRFRNDVYLEDIADGTPDSNKFLGLDSNNKVIKRVPPTADSATLASTVTVTNSTANTSFPVVFHDESNALLDDTGAFEYNPNSGKFTVPGGVRYGHSMTYLGATNAGDYGRGSEILYHTPQALSGTTTTAGALYVWKNTSWVLADADAENTCSQLMAIAIGTNSATDGMLLKGPVTLAGAYIAGTDSPGSVVYASTTAGRATLTAPSGSGDIVRVIGHSLSSGGKMLLFNPDNTYVEIA